MPAAPSAAATCARRRSPSFEVMTSSASTTRIQSPVASSMPRLRAHSMWGIHSWVTILVASGMASSRVRSTLSMSITIRSSHHAIDPRQRSISGSSLRATTAAENVALIPAAPSASRR
jgi:hypothetical protein